MAGSNQQTEYELRLYKQRLFQQKNYCLFSYIKTVYSPSWRPQIIIHASIEKTWMMQHGRANGCRRVNCALWRRHGLNGKKTAQWHALPELDDRLFTTVARRGKTEKYARPQAS
jgi:hypothetical protein